MPRQPREQRRETQQHDGLRWAQWLDDAMAETHTDNNTLISEGALHGATFDKTNVSRWRNGKTSIDPNHAVIVARILKREPAEALRAAGHDALADAIEDPRLARIRAADMSQSEMAVLEKEYREQIAALDREIERRVAEPTREAEDGEAQDESDAL